MDEWDTFKYKHDFFNIPVKIFDLNFFLLRVYFICIPTLPVVLVVYCLHVKINIRVAFYCKINEFKDHTKWKVWKIPHGKQEVVNRQK